MSIYNTCNIVNDILHGNRTDKIAFIRVRWHFVEAILVHEWRMRNMTKTNCAPSVSSQVTCRNIIIILVWRWILVNRKKNERTWSTCSIIEYSPLLSDIHNGKHSWISCRINEQNSNSPLTVAPARLQFINSILENVTFFVRLNHARYYAWHSGMAEQIANATVEWRVQQWDEC